MDYKNLCPLRATRYLVKLVKYDKIINENIKIWRRFAYEYVTMSLSKDFVALNY